MTTTTSAEERGRSLLESVCVWCIGELCLGRGAAGGAG